MSIFFLLFLISCSEPQVKERDETGFDPEMCNEQAAYEKGMSDAQNDKPMNTQFARSCREDLRERAYKGYRDGYQEGKKSKTTTLPPTPPQDKPTKKNNVYINIGGTQTISNPDVKKNDRAYFCRVEAFMQTFEDFGSTQLEAKKKVQDTCTAKYHKMHCEEVHCQKNE